MKQFVFGAISTLALLFFGGLAWLFSGGVPVATSSPELPFEGKIAGIAIHAALRGASEMRSPILSDDVNLMAGLKLYKANCAVCHGITGQEYTPIAQGLFPMPPALMPPDGGVMDDPVGETFWVIKNGIRMTGMPGFGKTLSDTEIWQLTTFLSNVDKLPQAVKDSMLKPGP